MVNCMAILGGKILSCQGAVKAPSRRFAMLFAVTAMVLPSQSAQADAVCYEYDALGRLTKTLTTSATCPSSLPDPGSQGAGSMAVKIGYDKAGNRTNYQVAGAEAYTRTTIIVVPLGGLTVLPIKR